jgi:DNA end-binding protein Ku
MAEQLTESDIRARAFWSGTITFGLVSIPVNLFPATRSSGVALRMVDEQGTPLARRYFCPKHEKELDRDEVARGYETEKGKFVLVTDDELEALEPRKSRDIDLRRFVPLDQLDPVFFERGYFLTPGGESTKAYTLLAATMEDAGRAGIATFVMRGKEYLVAIIAEKGILRAETLRFADEIRSPASIGLPEKGSISKADVTRIEKAIKTHTSAKLAPTELKDLYAERLLKLVKKKERKNEDVVDAPEEPIDEDDEEVTVIDLMEVLKKSLAGGSGATKKKRTTRKRKSA